MLIVVKRQENVAQGENRATKRLDEIVLTLGVRCVDSMRSPGFDQVTSSTVYETCT